MANRRIAEALFGVYHLHPSLPDDVVTKTINLQDDLMDEALLRFEHRTKYLNLRNEKGTLVTIKKTEPDHVMKFGEKLADLLAELGMTTLEVAKAGGWHHSTVYGWFINRTMPSATNLYRLAKVLNVPPALLIDFITDADLEKDKE